MNYINQAKQHNHNKDVGMGLLCFHEFGVL